MFTIFSYPFFRRVDKSKALSLVLHCCDISHPAKRWDLHHKWTTRLLEEFFRQGDKERDLGLPFSPLCDRNNIMIAESQIGINMYMYIYIFFNFMILKKLAKSFFFKPFFEGSIRDLDY